MARVLGLGYPGGGPMDRLAEGLSAEDLAHFRRCVAIFDRNIEQIRAEKSKRTEIQNP